MRLLTHVGAVHLVKLEEITGPIMHVAKLKGARDRKRGRGQEEPCGAGRLLVFNCEVLKVAKDHCGTSAELTLRGGVNERGRLCGFDCRDACYRAAKAHSYANLRRFSRCRRLSVRPAA